MQTTPEDIMNFWFMEVGEKRWFTDDPALDQLMCARFGAAYEKAAHDELKKWEDTPEGMLALLLLLDMFPRRMFRGTAKAYATDDRARELARTAIIKHFDDRIDVIFKLFFYLPFVHSEQDGDQRLGNFYIRERTKNVPWVDGADEAQAIVHRFSRFPHRNAILGRETTPEEEIFLLKAGQPALL